MGHLTARLIWKQSPRRADEFLEDGAEQGEGVGSIGRGTAHHVSFDPHLERVFVPWVRMITVGATKGQQEFLQRLTRPGGYFCTEAEASACGREAA